MSEYMDPNLSKLSVRKDLRITVKRIAADRNEYIYDLAEKVFRDAFPEYFQNLERKSSTSHAKATELPSL
jgi:hypothetical protein